MNSTTKILPIAAAAALSIVGCASTTPPSGEAAKFAAQEKTYQAASTAMPQMTAAQTTQYRAEYQAAKAKWAAMTPAEQASTVAAARQKKIAELTAMERYGQNDDMLRETEAQSAELKAQHEAAKQAWAKLTPEQKKAATQAAWQKKRADLTAMERVGQRDDTYLLPW
jgi:colicin import membrane protein